MSQLYYQHPNPNLTLTLTITLTLTQDIIKPRNKDKWIADNFPDFTFDGCKLEYVSQFRYLGHIIKDNLNDDDIRREIKNLFVHRPTNMLISRFSKCSTNVKLILFKSFCMCYQLEL